MTDYISNPLISNVFRLDLGIFLLVLPFDLTVGAREKPVCRLAITIDDSVGQQDVAAALQLEKEAYRASGRAEGTRR